MSDINLHYTNAASNIQTQRTNMPGYTQQADNKNETASTQSLVKSYFDSLRERSDGEAKKLLEDLENSQLSQITKMFSEVQTSTVDNTSRLFEDLRIKPVEELDSLENAAGSVNLNGNVGTPVAQQTATPVEQPATVSGIKEAAEKQVTEAPSDSEKSEKAEEADGGDKTDDTPAKRVRKPTTQDQISADNMKLGEISQRAAEKAQESGRSVERSVESGLIDRNYAYDAAEEFLKSLNEFQDEIADSANNTVSGKAHFVSNMTEQYKSDLLSAGIEIYGNNELRINREQFEMASDEALERVFSQKNSFTDFIEGQARQIAAYAQTDEYQRANVYSESGNISQVSSINGIYVNMLG